MYWQPCFQVVLFETNVVGMAMELLSKVDAPLQLLEHPKGVGHVLVL